MTAREAIQEVFGRLAESPKYYPGEVRYQHRINFLPISPGNLASYTVLADDGHFVYTVTPGNTAGYVFAEDDWRAPPAEGVVPILRLMLRDSPIPGLKQAYKLRIQEGYARQNIASRWYLLYAASGDGVVSDFEHLEGGMLLWTSLIGSAPAYGLRVSLYNTVNGDKRPVSLSTPASEIWSQEDAGKSTVLVMEPLRIPRQPLSDVPVTVPLDVSR